MAAPQRDRNQDIHSLEGDLNNIFNSDIVREAREIMELQERSDIADLVMKLFAYYEEKICDGIIQVRVYLKLHISRGFNFSLRNEKNGQFLIEKKQRNQEKTLYSLQNFFEVTKIQNLTK